MEKSAANDDDEPDSNWPMEAGHQEARHRPMLGLDADASPLGFDTRGQRCDGVAKLRITHLPSAPGASRVHIAVVNFCACQVYDHRNRDQTGPDCDRVS